MLPVAHNGCACVCHRVPGVMHCFPCCAPSTRPAFEPGYGAPGKHTVKGIGAEGLWAMDPAKRPIQPMGFFTGTLAGGEDEVIVIAAGARTSFKNRIVEDRATIRGGLAALKAAGVEPYASVNVDALKSGIFQSNKQDAALVRAAGGQGDKQSDVKDAANAIRQVVIDHHLARAAWGARGLYILGNLKGFTVSRGVSGVVSGLLGPVGMIISGAMAAHGAISGAVMKGIADRLKTDYDEGLQEGIEKLAQDAAKAPSTHAGHAGKGGRSNALQARPAAGFVGFLGQTLGAIPPLGWVAIATGAAGIGYLATRPSSSSPKG